MIVYVHSQVESLARGWGVCVREVGTTELGIISTEGSTGVFHLNRSLTDSWCEVKHLTVCCFVVGWMWGNVIKELTVLYIS